MIVQIVKTPSKSKINLIVGLNLTETKIAETELEAA